MKLIGCFFLLLASSTFAQFTKADSLRGGYGATRNWWDLTHYDLNVDFDISNKSISGSNEILFDITELREIAITRVLQIDLQDPMVIDSVFLNGEKIDPKAINKQGAAYLIRIDEHDQSQYIDNKLLVFFHGSPRQAIRAPWDGGIIWKKDANGNPWVSIACQGLGASVWFPCKDSQFDEPLGVNMHYTCPANLVCVSNGKFEDKVLLPGNKARYSWTVSNPINNYCMIPYIGDYVNIHEHYKGEKGNLEVDYWVLKGNEDKAKTHFKDVPRTLEALEYWFGPYPFYEDGYKLVEAPHLGMEHQSAIAYGNGFKFGYMGSDLSGTGMGLNWDFIIVHESGHEWFGNNITSKDIADMWIHEGFTDYSETLFTEYWYGKEAGATYCRGLRKNILNDKPIIGKYGVHNEGSGDMYYKGANMLHTIRTILQNDSLFRSMLREMNATFYHQTVTTAQIEAFMSEKLGMDLSKIFDQYLREKYPPTLRVKKSLNGVKYRWVNCVKGFEMPLIVHGEKWNCTTKWTRRSSKLPYSFYVDPNMYIFKND